MSENRGTKFLYETALGTAQTLPPQPKSARNRNLKFAQSILACERDRLRFHKSHEKMSKFNQDFSVLIPGNLKRSAKTFKRFCDQPTKKELQKRKRDG